MTKDLISLLTLFISFSLISCSPRFSYLSIDESPTENWNKTFASFPNQNIAYLLRVKEKSAKNAVTFTVYLDKTSEYFEKIGIHALSGRSFSLHSDRSSLEIKTTNPHIRSSSALKAMEIGIVLLSAKGINKDKEHLGWGFELESRDTIHFRKEGDFIKEGVVTLTGTRLINQSECKVIFDYEKGSETLNSLEYIFSLDTQLPEFCQKK